MKKHKGKITLAIFLVVTSFLLHMLHYVIFQDMHHLLIFLVADIAFTPLEVLFVTLVFERIIELQDKKQKDRKMNMLIELFYLEMGYPLLSKITKADRDLKNYQDDFKITSEWDKDDFTKLSRWVMNHKRSININAIDLQSLNDFLNEKKNTLVLMISNPALVEHESFSDALLATFHMLDELESRDLSNLPEDDLKHLAFDIERAYNALTAEWVPYMKHLSKEYPYLYYTALQKNPFIL